MPRLRIVRDRDAVAEEAARLVCDALSAAIERRGEAHIALTGGSSAAPLYGRLAVPPYRDAVDWQRVHLWWSDERYVPSEHPESNARLAEQLLLGLAARMDQSGQGASSTDVLAGVVPGIPVPSDHVHSFPVNEAIGRGPGAEQWAAAAYAEALREYVPQTPDGVPVFDVVLLGVGPDGHILSVFPDSPALRDDAPLVLPIPAPDHVPPHVERLTLNPRILEAAGLVVVMVIGAAKAEILARLFDEPADPRRRPAHLAMRDNAIWIVDEAAAARLSAKVREAAGAKAAGAQAPGAQATGKSASSRPATVAASRGE
jgi:6-phosphogluconolactonase